MAREITARTRAIPRVEERQVKIVSLKKIIWQRYVRARMAVAGTFIVAFMLFFAYIGPFLVPYAPDQVNLRERFATLKGVERAAQSGDYVSIDLAATVGGEPIDDATAANLSYEVGSDSLAGQNARSMRDDVT